MTSNYKDLTWNQSLVQLHNTMFDSKGVLKPQYAQHINCPICNESKAVDYCTKDLFCYKRCVSCGMIYMNPRLNNEATLSFYNSLANEIYNKSKFHTSAGSTIIDDGINKENLELIQEYYLNNKETGKIYKKKILEIGCGNGYFLKAAVDAGLEAYGVELNEKNIQVAKESSGAVAIYNDDLLSLPLSDASFDIIYMRDVIEHLHDPIAILTKINQLLKPEGIVFIETHNIEGLIHKLVRGKHTCIFGFEHPVHWSPATLKKALNTCGLNTLSINFESRDFTLSHIFQYFISPTSTTIFPWKANIFLKYILKILCFILRLPIIRHIDCYVFPRFANAVRAGSTMKIIAMK